MTDKHTPGPWHVDTLDGTVYAANHRTVPQNVADSRLIAAAPELLDALQRAEFQLARLLTHENSRAALPCLDAMRAAIAKATEG